ncbi:hypothetical protein EXIGLDRAFT_840841 [Exidia glandulosa HHB12029]|uniref:F-box domain-containing protein n=1 Tax=Exidia glandulosa HHB12029 TaxID=1314781 RepID=A0A165ZWT2_EXIGL|nr:hypothetical protein EXIGLDRAFT_840841 [Exidia glandulosa HHB12029]
MFDFFSRLPLEIVREIITAAAEDNIGRSPRWVAQSLAVVCREFRDIVDPVLVRTVRLSVKHYWAMWEKRDRFTRATHFIKHFSSVFVPPRFISLVSFTGSQAALQDWVVNHHLSVPPWVTFETLCSPNRATQDSFAFLNGATRLHIQRYAHQRLILTTLPTSLTHLILNPEVEWHVTARFEYLTDDVTALLASSNTLRRILFRTIHLRSDEAVILITNLQAVVDQLQDTRIWLDDSVSYEGMSSEISAQLRYEEANEQDSVWFSGRQLYIPRLDHDHALGLDHVRNTAM